MKDFCFFYLIFISNKYYCNKTSIKQKNKKTKTSRRITMRTDKDSIVYQMKTITSRPMGAVAIENIYDTQIQRNANIPTNIFLRRIFFKKM